MNPRSTFLPQEFTEPEELTIPLGLEREHRVALIGQCAQDLLAGKLPDATARLFVAGALMSWLEEGGDLCRDYFRVTKRASKRTASAIWRELHHPDDAHHRDEGQSREAG